MRFYAASLCILPRVLSSPRKRGKKGGGPISNQCEMDYEVFEIFASLLGNVPIVCIELKCHNIYYAK